MRASEDQTSVMESQTNVTVTLWRFAARQTARSEKQIAMKKSIDRRIYGE